MKAASPLTIPTIKRWSAVRSVGGHRKYCSVAPLNDGVKDFLLGGTGADDFYRDVTDSVTDFQFNIDQNK